MKAKKIKSWCDVNLSSVAWRRIAVKVSPHFRCEGLNSQDLANPNDTISFNERQYDLVKKTIEDTYDVQLVIEE